MLSSFYALIYLGVGLPVIGVGFLATSIGLLPAVQAFAALIAVLCLVLLIALAEMSRRPRLNHLEIS